MTEKKLTYYEKNKEKVLKQQQEKRNAKYEGKIEGVDYIACKECGFHSSELATHITIKHGMTIDEYKLKHNVDSVKSQSSRDRVKGNKNPAYQHGGTLSPYSKKFIYADTTDREEVFAKVKKTKIDNNSDQTKLKYWIEKCDGDIALAEELYKDRQTTFNLVKCIERHGEVEGQRVWLARQEKWHKSYKKSTFSKISQVLFWNISAQLKDLSTIFFAQLGEDKKPDYSGVNNEVRLTLDKVILPDFIDIESKKIIEFDGTYWHGEVGRGNKERESTRDEILRSNGYKVLHIKEYDFKNDKQGTIDKCLNFLRQ